MNSMMWFGSSSRRKCVGVLVGACTLLALSAASSIAQSPADTVRPVDQPIMDRLYDDRVEVESVDCLSINLFTDALKRDNISQPGSYTIQSPDDERYAADKNVKPRSVSWRNRAIRIALRKEMLTKHTAIFLELPEPLRSGCVYRVVARGIVEGDPALQAIKFDQNVTVSDAIRVNQLGYVTGQTKRAYIGQYRGDGGALPLKLTSFELVTDAGKVAFTGQATRRDVNEQLVGQEVWELDFSAFNDTGNYRLRVPSVGVSYPFAISPTALSPLAGILMQGHYQQRCGYAAEEPFTRHTHVACHTDDAFLDAEAAKAKFVAPKKPPLYPQPDDGRQQKATGGHHDAGDYGKYTCTGAEYTFTILQTMDLFPDKFQQDNFGLPYSGNGIPDILEEAKWELDWLENMQDPADGGVYGVIRPRSGGYEHFMPPVASKRLFFPKDTIFTAAYAASLAYASMSPTLQKHYPKDAQRYLQRALKSWEFLEKNDRVVEYFHYGSIFGDWDERCWAAAALYAATGDEKFHKYFLKNFEPERARWGWMTMFEGVGNAVLTYVFASQRPRDEAMLARCKKMLLSSTAVHQKNSDTNPYRLGLPGESIRHGSYGWFFPGASVGHPMLLAYALQKDPALLTTALDNLNFTCGTNPHGYFLLTGLGAKRNIECVDDESVRDNIVEPVPGLPLGIGTESFYWLNEYQRRPSEGMHPSGDKWPLLNRWYDGFNVRTEFTMGPMARETLVALFFDGERKASSTRPTVKIIADKLTGPPPLDVKFRAEVTGGDGKPRFFFWDFDNEKFSSQQSVTHRFTEAGRRHRVAVTVVDDQGQRYFDKAEVWVEQPTPFSREVFKPDASTVALFHFDGDLSDSGPQGLKLSVISNRAVERQGYRFSDAPPRWMSAPSGKCLVLDGAEHFTVALTPSKIKGFPRVPLRLEMMLYLEAFDAWGYVGNPTLLGLRALHDSWMGWIQPTWEKSGAPRFGSAAGDGVPYDFFAKSFPKNRWCHVAIVFDGKDTATFLLDGKPLGSATGRIFRDDPTPVNLSFGPLRGMIDELRLTVGP